MKFLQSNLWPGGPQTTTQDDDNNTQLTIHEYMDSLAFMPNGPKMCCNASMPSNNKTVNE